MHWILILTVLTNNGPSVSEVGPFVNKNNCTKASNKWLRDMDKIEKKVSGRHQFSAICVQK